MEPRPKAILWYNIYLGILALMYLGVAALSLVFFCFSSKDLEIQDSERIFSGVVCLALGVPFALASLLPFAFYPKPWLWIYGIVMIALGLTSCCFWPICIPLLIYWIKPDVRAYFGKIG